jgi:two-component system sensor histidine kinase DegS
MSLRRLQSLDSQPPERRGADSGPVTPAQVVEQTHQQYNSIQKELNEIEVLIKQSSNEVERLAQRNAQLTNRLRTMEANIDTVPRQDIKEIYTAAQESQMRLFMMRGQVEQLQSKQEILRRYAEGLRKVLDISDNLLPMLAAGSGGPKNVSRVNMGEATGIIKIIDAQENERLHLANQLHDGPAQSLTNLILQAEICERLFDSDPFRARSELSELKSAVTGTFQKVREFIFDLRPMMLDDLGLNPTLKKSVEDYEQKTGIASNLTISGKDQRIAPHLEVTIFRAIQHLLTNVKQHAQATHIQVNLTVQDDRAMVSVEDDGIGFNVNEAISNSRQRKTIGLISLQEQVEMLGGELEIDSSPGKGTRVRFWLPTV